MTSIEKKRLEERTLEEYVPGQAKAYAANRGSYHAKLFDTTIEQHRRSTGGCLGTLLDVGCALGNSTRPLAKHFGAAYGIDLSSEMTNTAMNIEAEVRRGKSAK